MVGALRSNAIALRKKGWSYSEILKRVPVAKSTLSLWLRGVNLSKKQKQKLTRKKLKAAHRGGKVKKNKRIALTKKIKKQARDEIGGFNKRDLWLVGIALYWAEGSKQKENNPSQGLVFSNSDPLMLKVFLKWLLSCLKIKKNDIKFEIYLNKNFLMNLHSIKRFWSGETGFPIERFSKIYFKKNKINNKKKFNLNYFGLIRIKVKNSTNLNRRISGWIEGICNNAGWCNGSTSAFGAENSRFES